MLVSLSAVVLLAVPILSAEWWENTWDNDNNNNNWNQRTRYQCWSGGRWVPEGTENERGRYWYTCRQGSEEPSGCLDDNRRRLRIGESYNAQGGYEMTCTLGRDGYLSFEMTGCYDEDSRRAYKEGESWDSQGRKFWYTCKRITDWHLRKDIGGCLNNGQRVQLDETVDNFQTETFWKCDRKSDGSVAMCIKGCRHNNQRYKIGEQWPEEDFVYYCKARVECESVEKICIGCQSPNGQKLYDGDRYFRDEAIYQCDIRQDHNAHRLVGCIQKDSYSQSVVAERVIGCRWYEDRGQHAVEKTCKEVGGVAKSEIVGCIFKEDGIERLLLDPDSFTIWFSAKTNYQKLWVGCEKGYSDEYNILMLNENDIDHGNRMAKGSMRFKPPRG